MELTIPKKLLVVEDEARARMLYQRELEDRGYKVLLAANGHEAFAAITDNKLIDLILLDVKMPDMNGVEFLRRLRRDGKTMPVILCTAFSAVADPFEMQELGVVGTFMKPVDLESLASKIRSVLPEQKKI